MPTAPRIVDRFADLADVLAGAIAMTGGLTLIPLANPGPSQQVLFRLSPPPTDLVAAGFNFIQAEFANAGGGDQSSRKNQTWGFGYNQSSQTPSHDKSGDPAFKWDFESFYNPSPGTAFLEHHFTYTSADGGNSARIWSIAVNRGTHFIQVAYQVDTFTVKDHALAEILTAATGNVRVVGAVITRENNDGAFARQLNFAQDGYVEIARVDSNDRVAFAAGRVFVASKNADIADGETALIVQRNKAGAYSTQRVSMGAVDSGGSGFKVLRVPN